MPKQLPSSSRALPILSVEEREREVSVEINIPAVKLCFLNVCFQKTSWSLGGISESLSSKDGAYICQPALLHSFTGSLCGVFLLQNIYWGNLLQSLLRVKIRQIIPAISWSLCNCSTTQDWQDVLWHEEHYLSGADAFLCFDKSSCPGILGDLSRHDDGRETDPPRMCSGRRADCSE